MNEATEDRVLVHGEGSIAILTLNYPRRMNAFGLAMRQQMWERLLELESDEDVRAIVLTGAGGNFCAGGDITEMAQRPVLQGRMRMELAVRIFRLLVTGPKPFICAVEGNAAGCGVSFAAAMGGRGVPCGDQSESGNEHANVFSSEGERRASTDERA